ncbi:probable LRR receptor-like serine/threonine-protein kinase At2g16250 [Ricinus communis]|uniref:Lrr receptor protein kinase, putative n=1 Tax=Ricinus communis TaxID=3988 RepID=B9R7U7_RICCO|nr:probable LRR receptor-like serine/threonine-protein kinase At2g16250 [Ricinus communis]XP_015576258.1 probable LRR receptor-like serine/threonine-protein kinase At2g16250 [Ricinus communis]XP_048226950.1 probable LRR receptor-like serine/threonine-protein kinase At2g16250 [Ricinus communis]XP_048226951.1 probable LRR receptor-like serine/threonine-protein kinase At2g16250 [Ricinus communis]EEF52577.1 lrr receptor protein kinase, putative [Ricinus communis]|eukprot:XP_015576254.1 probable LRR receptor-like serine/threonine-protein kinase At2g16250 [Ricinus communis]
MEKTLQVLLQISSVLLLIRCTLAQQAFLNSSTERLALLDLRSSLGLRSTDWPIKSDPCSTWNGVHCKNGHVTGINISGFKRTHIGRQNRSFSVDSLVNLTFLESFNASSFSLPGPIPSWFGYRLGSLQVLDLRFSSVAGPIPESIGNLTTLNALYLSDNRLTGSVPYALGQLVKLSVLDLSRNSLTGQIPTSFALPSNLSRLDLSSNYLSGPIPYGLGNISTLQFLDLSDNSLAASIPVELGNLSRLFELNLTKNSLSGSLPVEFIGLTSLQRLEIGDNGLEGVLPDIFTTLDNLRVVVLSGNNLDGAIPGALLSLPNLQVLDLSGNNFTGILSNFSSNGNAGGALFNLSNNLLYGSLVSPFRNFSLVDLSGNYIQGKVPDGSQSNISLDRNCLQAVLNQRSLEECKLFYDERGLNFDNFGAPESTQPPSPEPAPKKRKRWIYILMGLLVGVAFIVILVLMMVVVLRKCDKRITNQRGSANVGPVPEGDIPSLPKDPANISSLRDSFTYEQLLSSTRAFSEANLIRHGHSGDLFQGLLDGGCPIIVKKVDFRSKKESYMTELELFSKYSHTRLVPFLGHCSENENEKLLVYKYMPNGDLASSLYRVSDLEDDSLQSLDWITRLKIAIGAAEGLAYLHHECNPPLVHRDIQASSILLDDKFEVRIGSLSEVRIQEGDSHHNVLTRFLRKPQSSEPAPSGSPSVSCAYDVYCFGKVLLELITGKLGISKSDDATTKEWLEHTLGYISVYDKELVTKIVDPSLIVDEDLLEEVWAMAIVARSCLNPKPMKRPPMKYILKALENPLKVVREESYSSQRLRTTSSRRSWSTAFFGSWRHSSSDNATIVGHTNREGGSGLRQPGRVGSYGSGGIEHSSSNKRFSNEIFPEPLEMQDLEQQDEN